MTGGHSPMSPPSGYAPGVDFLMRHRHLCLLRIVVVVVVVIIVSFAYELQHAGKLLRSEASTFGMYIL